MRNVPEYRTPKVTRTYVDEVGDIKRHLALALELSKPRDEYLAASSGFGDDQAEVARTSMSITNELLTAAELVGSMYDRLVGEANVRS